MRREPERGNQNVATVTVADAAEITREVRRPSNSVEATGTSTPSELLCSDDIGVF
jgi:hypothetical protein